MDAWLPASSIRSSGVDGSSLLFNDVLMLKKPHNLILIYSWDGIRRGCAWRGRLMTPDDYKNQDYLMRLAGFSNVVYVTDLETTCAFQENEEIKCMSGCTDCLKRMTDEALLIKKH